MSESFVIQWKSTVNGRVGKGTKIFSRAEGEELVQELNREYPDMVHELILVPPDPDPREADRTSTPETREKSPTGLEPVTTTEPPPITNSHSFPE